MGATTPAPKSRRRSPAQPRRAATPAAPRPQIARETTPSLERTGHPLAVTLSGHTERAWLYRTPPGPGPQVFFIEHPDFFDRAGIYGDNNGDYPDNDRRFAFFCLAALTALPEIAPETQLLHAHDWHTALAPVYLRTAFAGDAGGVGSSRRAVPPRRVRVVRPDERTQRRHGPLGRRGDRQPLPRGGAAHGGRRIRAARSIHCAGRPAGGNPERHRSGSVEPRDRSGPHRELLERGPVREAALQGGAAAGLRPGPAGTHAALRDECADGIPEGTGPGARRRSAGNDGRAVHFPGRRGAPLPRGAGKYRRRGTRSRRGRVHVHRSSGASVAGRSRRAAHAVTVRAMRAHADARAALRRGARRPPGGRPQGQHYRRRERVPVR